MDFQSIVLVWQTESLLDCIDELFATTFTNTHKFIRANL